MSILVSYQNGHKKDPKTIQRWMQHLENFELIFDDIKNHNTKNGAEIKNAINYLADLDLSKKL